MTTIVPELGTRCPAALITGIRHAVRLNEDWPRTAELVAAELRTQLPGPDILSAQQRRGDPGKYQCHLLHAEPSGTFSVVALVWRPGQATTIHDHVTWGAFAVLQGAEHEETFALTDGDAGLLPLATNHNRAGDVTAFAPPGDIHRITNSTDEVVIQLHVYGTDISMLGTSVRRIYDLPVH